MGGEFSVSGLGAWVLGSFRVGSFFFQALWFEVLEVSTTTHERPDTGRERDTIGVANTPLLIAPDLDDSQRAPNPLN